jgi:putative hemolysin
MQNKKGIFEVPDNVIKWGRYYARFAKNEEDLQLAFKLRFEVFNLELGEGLEESYQDEQDRDKYDDVCHHLMVFDGRDDSVIGTYRMQTYEQSKTLGKFYSQEEFDFEKLPESELFDAVEVGRACVHKDYRNGKVLGLLWKGIGFYMTHFKKKYLFGCCSLPGQDIDLAYHVWRNFQKQDLVWKNEWQVTPIESVKCFDEKYVSQKEYEGENLELPNLFQLYINYTAKVCGPPAIDRKFNTIDFLICLNIENMDERSRKFYFKKYENN